MEQGNGMLTGLIAVYTHVGFIFEAPVSGITSGRARALVGAGVWTNVAQGIAKAVGDLITKTVGHAV